MLQLWNIVLPKLCSPCFIFKLFVLLITFNEYVACTPVNAPSSFTYTHSDFVWVWFWYCCPYCTIEYMNEFVSDTVVPFQRWLCWRSQSRAVCTSSMQMDPLINSQLVSAVYASIHSKQGYELGRKLALFAHGHPDKGQSAAVQNGTYSQVSVTPVIKALQSFIETNKEKINYKVNE